MPSSHETFRIQFSEGFDQVYLLADGTGNETKFFSRLYNFQNIITNNDNAVNKQ